ncbi:hypothetical protein BCY86_04270 [Pajaroellobacter abortibovis]|uniref:Uncharacterized protein n=1 Tax=Pajaroellobacter abortibovis TaxID=1882918 RepID=A0A1L6MWZ8_9BACT|nr:hypothetical protein BCY86_04270 [Pajaroellobacter abortibovis]
MEAVVRPFAENSVPVHQAEYGSGFDVSSVSPRAEDTIKQKANRIEKIRRWKKMKGGIGCCVTPDSEMDEDMVILSGMSAVQ